MSAPQLKQHANKFWYVEWSERGRSKRVSTRTTRLDEAKGFFSQWLLMENAAPAELGAAFTVADLWAVYDAKHVQKNVASPATLAASWKNLSAHFGSLPVGGVNQDAVDAYEAKRRTGKIGRPALGPTVRRELVALRACLNWCAEPKRKIIDPAAIPAFDLPADGEPRDRWLRTEETQKLLNAAAGLRRGHRLSRGERFLWLALETAARKQAIMELTWDRVDFEAGMIHYNVPGRKLTKKRRTSVPISAALMPILVRAESEKTGPLVMDNDAEIWATVQAVARAAGFGPEVGVNRPSGTKPKKTGISPHVLRHTAATQMARRGVPLYDIAGVLGNTLAMVEKVYAKHCPGALKAAVDRISNSELEAAE